MRTRPAEPDTGAAAAVHAGVEPRLRRALEWTLRLLALGLIGWALWGVARPAVDSPRFGHSDLDGLESALIRWSTGELPDSVHLALAAAPAAVERAWLEALRRSGVGVGWTDQGVAPLALEVYAVGGPLGGSWALVAGPADARVVLADERSTLDSLRTGGSGGALHVPDLVGTVSADLGGQRATAALRDSLELRPVLVRAEAGWEARFLVTALEERGWTVDARLRVGPGLEVSQGASLPLDTANYAAIVLADTSGAEHAAEIGRFVRMGGGLVLAGTAARAAALQPLAPGLPGPPIRAPAPPVGGPGAELAPDLLPVVSPRADAVPLSTQPGPIAVAARRDRLGRVLQVGYTATWRWRMTGDDGAPAAHRAWWSDIVAAAAYRPAHTRAAAPTDAAPRVALFDALGTPAPQRPVPLAAAPPAWPAPWLPPLLLGLLLAEWASRRLRGAR